MSQTPPYARDATTSLKKVMEQFARAVSEIDPCYVGRRREDMQIRDATQSRHLNYELVGFADICRNIFCSETWTPEIWCMSRFFDPCRSGCLCTYNPVVPGTHSTISTCIPSPPAAWRCGKTCLHGLL